MRLPPNKKITGFLSMSGHDCNNEIMVIGRAVNGWDDGIYPNELRNQAFAINYAQKIFDGSIEDPKYPGRCPMLWITRLWGVHTGYNTARSAFWRVIREVVDGLEIANIHKPYWPSHIVWSNLYKIAPANGGNPGGALCNIQLQGCVELLKIEIATYRPRRILFLTGMNWAEPFINAIHGNIHSSINRFTQVETHGKAVTAGHQYTFVVASHPQGKPEVTWVNEVLQVFRAA
ncbi:hypothetical protein [Candidatus Competibacter denitrificans]|uniref:hypothetical protein n=1 Tax=Candidatus Competibacter denitrificans TaxID=1400862 RepID=UPI0011129898|nr:hypothetical protein [Candidatus Competibacter denitrificans]